MPSETTALAPPKPLKGVRKFPALDLQPLKQFFAPFTTKEYTPDRAALVPAFSTLPDPFSLNASHYNLYNPPATDPDDWWPQEHMARRRVCCRSMPGRTFSGAGIPSLRTASR
ncbi:hypothetical protein [Gemmatimonas sp.]|uniref:hypothetical protein n=1 Tax=Gemmatimonas sp. TaxID=1962908 RepID=UPI00356B5FD5